MIFLLRLITQTVWLALGQIWANKLRSILTCLGIIIGVAAVIATVASTKGLEKFVLKEFGTVGANKVWIFPRWPQQQRDRYNWRQIRLTTKEIDGIMPAAPSLLRMTPIIEMSGEVQFGKTIKQAVSVQGVRPSWHDIEDRAILQGRPLTQLDEEERRYVCVINDKAIGEFGLDTNCVGQTILVSGRRYMIIGVVETKSVSPMFGGDEARSEVYIPFRTAEMLRTFPRMYAVAQTKSPELFEDAKAEVGFYLRKTRNLKPDDPDTFGIEAIEQFISQFKKIASGITALAGGIVGISLLVGGIGIMNIMLSSVSERTREIGLRKAVGAKPSVILTQFLVEAITLCLVGGAVGLLLGQAMIWGVAAIPKSPLAEATVPAWAIALAVGFSAATGVIFGMFPAIKAARLNPIEALRHE